MSLAEAVPGKRGRTLQEPAAHLLIVSCTTLLSAHAFLWENAGGIGIGLYIAVLCAAVWLGRRSCEPARAEWPLLAVFALTVMQTGRFVSLSNIVTLLALLFFFTGAESYRALRSRALCGVEMALAYFRPLALVMSLVRLRPPNGLKKLWWGLGLCLPVSAVVLAFALLLGGGNQILGNWGRALFAWVEAAFEQFHINAGESAFLLFMTALSAPLVLAPAQSWVTRQFERVWPRLDEPRNTLLLRQWQGGLIALNLLFGLTNLIDVVYLWFGRSVPEGVTYSGYVHHGVYALTASTMLSATLMALLTQHPQSVRRNSVVRWGCRVWIVQNLLLISGVFLRLKLYVDGLGYTPKRVHVACFLLLVLGGYLLLHRALKRDYNLQWLLARNGLLLFWFFALLQFLDVKHFVAEQNLTLYQEGKIEMPMPEFLESVGPEAVPMLIAIAEDASAPEADAAYARELLLHPETGGRRFQHLIETLRFHTDHLKSYQYRAANAASLYQDYRLKQLP